MSFLGTSGTESMRKIGNKDVVHVDLDHRQINRLSLFHNYVEVRTVIFTT